MLRCGGRPIRARTGARKLERLATIRAAIEARLRSGEGVTVQFRRTGRTKQSQRSSRDGSVHRLSPRPWINRQTRARLTHALSHSGDPAGIPVLEPPTHDRPDDVTLPTRSGDP